MIKELALDEERYYTIRQAAWWLITWRNELRPRMETVRRWIESGKLKAEIDPKTSDWRIPGSALKPLVYLYDAFSFN